MGWTCSTRGREEYCIQNWLGGTEIDPSEDIGMNGRIELIWVLEKCHGRLSTLTVWIRIGTSGGLLWIR